MVQAIINIDDHTNRILNIVKARHDLKDKSQAIELMAIRYEEDIMEPHLRPEYIAKLKRIKKNKKIYVGTIDDFKKRYGIK